MDKLRPKDIEHRSMAIIDAELHVRGITLAGETRHAIKRAIHASADLAYAEILHFSPGAVQEGLQALRDGATLVTDTQMACAGLSRPAMQVLGCRARCFTGEAEAAGRAQAQDITRSAAGMDLAAALPGPLVFIIGNAPTALLRLEALMDAGRISPALIIGVPVGFVNVVEAKERILKTAAPCIIARGRRGGSGVAAAIANALLYEACGREQF